MSKFGKEFKDPWPPVDNIPLSLHAWNLLKECAKVQKPTGQNSSVRDVIGNSLEFPIMFGSENVRIQNQPEHRWPDIEKQIASAYPVVHERAFRLYLEFLEHKQKFGNAIEKKVYSGMGAIGFIDRLLLKRCVCFFGDSDHYLRMTGIEGFGDYSDVGTINEKKSLALKDVLSYDENKLSALLSVSSHMEFLNNGNRRNRAIPNRHEIETEGVLIGYVGPFLNRPGQMDYQDIVIATQQNKPCNGYGNKCLDQLAPTCEKNYRRIWNRFYGECDHQYFDITDAERRRFPNFQSTENFFDNLTLKKRYAISFDTLLLESEARAARAGKQAYIHIVGIGLGVWRAVAHQEEIFLDTFGQRLKALVDRLPHVAVAHFAWFNLTECEEFKHDDVIASPSHPRGGIRTLISRRNPADKLDSADMLLIISYAWDGNAQPGNEFWLGCLGNSSDSSTASSTLVTELHNGHINREMVSGRNLHIASAQYGVVHVAEYARSVLQRETPAVSSQPFNNESISISRSRFQCLAQ